ncbi:hypothetical protein [Streptomyces sp. NPDC102282]|uniref:hypothetical protein n=1 Tax=Streptomyces sp. NPDC102282 TaxID=3366154 RepID=UPI003817C7C3
MGIASAPANEVRERRKQQALAGTGEGATGEGSAGGGSTGYAVDVLRAASSPADEGPRTVTDSPPAPADERPRTATDSPPTPADGRPATRIPAPSTGPVFLDPSGRRSRTWRRAGTIAALCCVCYATTLVATLIGSDSSAPFLRLPRALGLDRETGPRPAPSSDSSRSASPSPGPAGGTTGPGALAAGPSLSAGPTAPEALRASPGPSDVPVVDTRPTAPPRASASGPPAQDADSGGSSTAEPSTRPGTGTGSETPAGNGDEGQGSEPDDPPSGSGPLGDLVGDLVGGLLGGLLGRT